MEKLIKAELGAKSSAARNARLARDPGARRQGRLDHSRLAGQDDRGLEHKVNGIPGTLDPTVIMRFWKLSKS